MELIGRARRAAGAIEARDIGAAEADIAAHAELADNLRMPYHQWVAVSMRAMRALLQGSPARAEQRAEEALDVLPARLDAVYAHLNQVTQVAGTRADCVSCERHFRRSSIGSRRRGSPADGSASRILELDRREDAQRWLRSLVDALPELPRNGLWPSALAVASVAAAALEDVDAAASVHRLLLPTRTESPSSRRPTRSCAWGPPVVHRVGGDGDGPVGGGRGPLRGRDPSQHASRREVTEARTQLGYARMLISAGRARDRPHVLDLLIVRATGHRPGDGCACQRGGTPARARGRHRSRRRGARKRVSPGG